MTLLPHTVTYTSTYSYLQEHLNHFNNAVTQIKTIRCFYNKYGYFTSAVRSKNNEYPFYDLIFISGLLSQLWGEATLTYIVIVRHLAKSQYFLMVDSRPAAATLLKRINNIQKLNFHFEKKRRIKVLLSELFSMSFT